MSKRLQKPKSGPGWIYVLDNCLGHYKIGRTNELHTRMKQLHIQLPFRVILYYAYQVDNAIQAEQELHDFYHERRLNGEWFALTEDDLDQIAFFANYSGVYESQGEYKYDPLKGAAVVDEYRVLGWEDKLLPPMDGDELWWEIAAITDCDDESWMEACDSIREAMRGVNEA